MRIENKKQTEAKRQAKIFPHNLDRRTILSFVIGIYNLFITSLLLICPFDIVIDRGRLVGSFRKTRRRAHTHMGTGLGWSVCVGGIDFTDRSFVMFCG